MNIIISGKNFHPSKANKQFVQEKCERLLRYDKSIQKIRIELDADKKERDNAKFRVEAWVGGRFHVQAGSQNVDLFSAVESVIRKIKVQLVKEKQKRQDRKKRV